MTNQMRLMKYCIEYKYKNCRYAKMVTGNKIEMQYEIIYMNRNQTAVEININ